MILQAKNIIKCFPLGNGEEITVLKGVNMDIKRGSLNIMKGRSGSGKTTMLNMLSTLDSPTSGEIWFDGNAYSGMNIGEKELLRRKEIGFVFQSIALIPVMNSYENVDFAMKLALGNAKDVAERKARIEQVLELVGMKERMYHMPGQMSGGEQQRVAIARAVAQRPKVLFADEPTGALDTEMSRHCMGIFRRLVEEEGLTIIMTTHDPNLMELGDVVFEMEDGQIVDRREYSW